MYVQDSYLEQGRSTATSKAEAEEPVASSDSRANSPIRVW